MVAEAFLVSPSIAKADVRVTAPARERAFLRLIDSISFV